MFKLIFGKVEVIKMKRVGSYIFDGLMIIDFMIS